MGSSHGLGRSGRGSPVIRTADVGLVAAVDLEQGGGQGFDGEGARQAAGVDAPEAGQPVDQFRHLPGRGPVVRAHHHVGVERVIEVGPRPGRQMVEGADHPRPGQGPGHARRSPSRSAGGAAPCRRPHRVRALAIEITILPASSSSRADTVVRTPSHGVATITRSAPAAPALSAGCRGRLRSGHRPRSSATAGLGPLHRARAHRHVDAGVRQLHGHGLAGRPGRSQHSDVHHGRLARAGPSSRPGPKGRACYRAAMRLVGRFLRRGVVDQRNLPPGPTPPGPTPPGADPARPDPSGPPDPHRDQPRPRGARGAS